MAWRPYENLINGELHNSTLGTVTGWIHFYRQGKRPLKVTLTLTGDFHQDIRGKKIKLSNPEPTDRNESFDRDGSYVDGLSSEQVGQVGDITAGLKVNGDYPYTDYPYVEWYSEANGRVVLELDPSQVEVIETNASPAPLTGDGMNRAEANRKERPARHLKAMADDIERNIGTEPILALLGGTPRKP